MAKRKYPAGFYAAIKRAQQMPVKICNPATSEGAADAERRFRDEHGKRFIGMDVVDGDIRIGSDPTQYAMYAPRLRAANGV